MSESVWYEQVSNGLVSYIQKIVLLPDASQNNIIVPVPVKSRKEEEEFSIEEYPSITIYEKGAGFDPKRYSPDRIVKSRDTVNNTLILEDSAIPYNMYIQLDFWSRLKSQMNEMTRLWGESNSQKYINLPVKDMSDISRNCFCRAVGMPTPADFLDGSMRTFRMIYNYLVWVELDGNIQETVPMIKGVSTETQV